MQPRAAGTRHFLKRIFGPPAAEPREYFYCIDILRGLAALAVVLHHYQHFYPAPDIMATLNDVRRSAHPLFWMLSPAYDYGQWAVQLFWGISGFVFANVYATKPAPAKEFWARRFARLYPLHIITLLAVAILQWIAWTTLGRHLIIGNNDWYHFVLQIFMASFWGFQEGHSFNAPIWSVSVEIISYGLFWLLLPWLFRWGLLIPISIVVVTRAILLAHFDNAGLVFILYCIVCFFMGAGINHFVHATLDRPAILNVCASVSFAAFIVIGPVLIMDNALAVPVFIAACLLCAAALENGAAGALARKVRFLGDGSYGVYLMHLPIQISILLVLDLLVGSRQVVQSVWFVGLFVTLACAAGWASFRFVERPLGAIILRRLLPAGPR